MKKEEICEWIGLDGQRYEYSVHNLPTNFNPGEYGNYIFAKKTDDDHWVPIYIGQGDLGVKVNGKHSDLECIKDMGATHVHVHRNDSEWVRNNEEHDLLESYLKVFKPFGCNLKGSNKEKTEETLFE
jgi:hypothetical protein